LKIYTFLNKYELKCLIFEFDETLEDFFPKFDDMIWTNKYIHFYKIVKSVIINDWWFVKETKRIDFIILYEIIYFFSIQE
jgi:hypothetical protein